MNKLDILATEAASAKIIVEGCACIHLLDSSQCIWRNCSGEITFLAGVK